MREMFSGLLGLFVLFLVIVIPIWLLIFLFSGAKKADEESEKEFNAQLTNLSEGSKAAYILAYNGRKKSAVVTLLLTIFLGGLGIHKFYLGKPVLGILYLVFSWTGIPSIIALVESFTVASTVRTMNGTAAQELVYIVQGAPPIQSPTQLE